MQPKKRLPGIDNLSDNSDMDLTEFRRRNLARALREKDVSRAELARRIDVSPPNVTQLINGPRSFGNEIARRIEEAIGLRFGWLDEEVPLTDQAINVARNYQQLNSQHRLEIESSVLHLMMIEEHEKEAEAIRRLNAARQG